MRQYGQQIKWRIERKIKEHFIGLTTLGIMTRGIMGEIVQLDTFKCVLYCPEWQYGEWQYAECRWVKCY